MARNYQEVPDQGGMFVNFKERGDFAEGFLHGVRVDESGKFGPKNAYDILQADGALVTVGATSDIDTKMKHVKVGQAVKITFREEIPLAGNKTVKKFKIEFCDAEPGEFEAAKKAQATYAAQQAERASQGQQGGGAAPF